MAAASYRARILIPKYGQTDNVKPALAANCGLRFAVRWPNLDLNSLHFYSGPLTTIRNTGVNQSSKL